MGTAKVGHVILELMSRLCHMFPSVTEEDLALPPRKKDSNLCLWKKKEKCVCVTVCSVLGIDCV